jgi:lysozyme
MTALPPVTFDGVIDTSHWQGAIDWPAVAASGVAFAFIKATEGARFVDPLFATNRKAALAAGLMVVPYHFVQPGDPMAQATHFITTANLEVGDVVMLDWETSAGVDVLLKIGASVLSATRRDPVGYYGEAKLEAADPNLSRWPLMLPEYPRGDTPGDYASLVTKAPRLPPGRSPARPYDFHQYTRAGTVPGITGLVDRSVWVGTLASLRAWYAGTAPIGTRLPPGATVS